MPFFGSRTKTCTGCRKEIDVNARFCPYCGKPTEATLGPCPHCGQPVAANANFCPNCGRQLGGARAPDLRGNVWRKSSDEFAVRVERADLAGGLYKDLEVQPGQQVIILVDGRAEEGRVGPGRYTMDSFFDRILTLGAGRHTTALLIDGGYVPLEFQVPGIYTQDNYQVDVRCVIGVQVANPTAFFTNVMKSGRTLTVSDLRNFLFDEVRDAVQEVVGRADFRGLATGLALKDRMATAVEQHLNETLATSGLQFGGVRTVEVRHPRLDALRQQWEEIRVLEQEAEADRTAARNAKLAEVEKRKALWEAQLQGEEQETVEQRQKVRIYEERAAVWEQARRAILSDEMNQIRSVEDFRDFLAKINERQVLRQEELDILAEDFANRKEDRARARAHAAYLAELERDYNRKQAELARQTDLTLEQMAAALRIEQQRLADEGVLDERRWQNDLAAMLRAGEKADWQRAEQQKQWIFDRQRQRDEQQLRQELEKAQALHQAELLAIQTDASLSAEQKRAEAELARKRLWAEQRRIELEIERLEDDEDLRLAREGINLLGEMKKVKRVDEEETRRIQREDELARARDAHQRELELRDQALRAEAQKQAHELAMLQARAQMSAEALMSLSAPDQARAIADLKKAEVMKGMTDEQVYALMAAQSPAVAQALAERFKAAAVHPQEVDAQTRALYERMLADIQRDREKADQLRERSEERFKEIFEKALESQRTGMVEIARATSGQPSAQSGPIVIMNPATGQPQVIQTGGPGGAQVAGGTGEVQICPRCRVKSPVGEKYCSNCGYNFYQA